MTQTIIADGTAGSHQKVIEILIRTSANAAKQPFVSHRKMPPSRVSGQSSSYVAKAQMRNGCLNTTAKEKCNIAFPFGWSPASVVAKSKRRRRCPSGTFYQSPIGLQRPSM
jgi:hypothetical protein